MGVYFYLVPKTLIDDDAAKASDWLDRELSRFDQIPKVLDHATEARKRMLADILLRMKPSYKEFQIRHEEIAEFDNISAHDARLKYRHLEINGPGVQFTIYDQHITIGVYSKIDLEELDAVLATLAGEGRFVLYNPQSEEVTDLSEESFH